MKKIQENAVVDFIALEIKDVIAMVELVSTI